MTGRELAAALLALPYPDLQVMISTAGEGGHAVVSGVSSEPEPWVYSPRSYCGDYEHPHADDLYQDGATPTYGYVLLEQ